MGGLGVGGEGFGPEIKTFISYVRFIYLFILFIFIYIRIAPQYEAHRSQSDHMLERILRCPTSFYLPQHERFSVSSFWYLGGAGKESISSSSGCWDFV